MGGVCSRISGPRSAGHAGSPPPPPGQEGDDHPGDRTLRAASELSQPRYGRRDNDTTMTEG